MENATWKRLQELFEEALELPVEQRDSYLQQHAESGALAREVRDLVDAHLRCSSLWQAAPTISTESRSDFHHAATLESGHVIGPYRIQEKITSGGMGIIYRALDTRLQRQIALKFLPGCLHRDDTARQRFMIEAQAASRLDHPNICVVHDIGETEEGNMYISMPFYEGETLATIISRGPLTPNDAIDIVIQVTDGLAVAHSHDIVHRDIKPANIMRTQEGLVKILDFGIAKMSDNDLTRTGVGIGTLAYMAPEQLNGKKIDARTDIWAVGATLSEMLSGKPAFPNAGLQEVLQAVSDEHYDPLTALPADVSPELRSLLRKAMQRNPDARYRNAEHMLDDLVRARRNCGGKGAAPRSDNTLRSKQEDPAYEWDGEFLDGVISLLLPWLGPITPKVVHRYARVSSTLDHFIQCVEGVLPEDAAGKSFAEKIRVKAAMQPNSRAKLGRVNNGVDNGFKPTPGQVAILEKHLVPQLGPIAAILIRRVAAGVQNWESLCYLLSQYLNDNDEAREFLDSVAVDTSLL